MPQPTWITTPGSLGTIPEGRFYQVPLSASAGIEDVYFKVIAGNLPAGIQLNSNGVILGVPKTTVKIQGVPTEVSRDVTSKFAVRAYTTKVVNGLIVTDRLADRTFTLTITGEDAPVFVTPAGNVASFFDGQLANVQIEYTDVDPDDTVTVRLISGNLPNGLTISRTGLISGVVIPFNEAPGVIPGYSSTNYDIYPFDFGTQSASRNYEFTLEVSDRKFSSVRTFEIMVYSRDSMTADTTQITSDNTFITADVVPVRTPVITNTPGLIGVFRSENFFAYKFNALDFDSEDFEFVSTYGLPPDLVLDSNTGWLYGYLIDQGATEITYTFGMQVRRVSDPSVISNIEYFQITVIGFIESEIVWLTDPDLGTIVNGSISDLAIKAVNPGGRSLSYRIVSGSNSKLPQGLMLMPSGNIVGRVSFNTFALDHGTTTFDGPAFKLNPTTFDMKFTFTVNAYAPAINTDGYSVSAIAITNGGFGFTGTPTVTISAPPTNGIQATVGAITIVGSVITAIAIANPGKGYIEAPVIQITGGGGSGATAIALITGTAPNAVSVNRTFTVTVLREYNEPYESLYIKCMPPVTDRALITQFVQNRDIFPEDLIYRSDDPYYGIAQNVIYQHAFGLNSRSLEVYVDSLVINHYWKNLTLGQVKWAQATDNNGVVLYDVIYSQIVDDLTNNQGQSVDKAVNLAYPVVLPDSSEVTTVYPNSLVNMRDQVVSVVGQVSSILPRWMLSKQPNGQVLGFVPAWVIAYVKPGEGARVIYNIQQKLNFQLNLIDFKVDRYELDRSMTFAWVPYEDSTEAGKWVPYPPAATVFDLDAGPPITETVFDGGSTAFITPANTTTSSDAFDKYLVFPRTNILG